MNQRVYIFRGAPASGKGTIVPEFANLLPKPVALIEQDTFRWGFHLIGRSIPEVTPDEHRFAYDNTVMLYERYLQSGNYTIIIEGLFTYDDNQSDQGNVKQLLELANQYGYIATSIVLTADKQTLIERNNNRQYSVPLEEFDSLYSGVHSSIDASELVIDSTRLTPKETTEKLRSLILE